MEGGVDSGKVAYRSKMFKRGMYILGGRCTIREDHIYMFKRGYILRGRVDSGRASYRCLKGGIFWDGRVDSVITSHNHEKRGGGVDPRMEG